mmetsp:Transcript_3149/g.3410  ORF Transcript_3149/g.3410 Transcript_3149/m.3410 type:complete len:328 (-) Transcript_3149:127-1110(-)
MTFLALVLLFFACAVHAHRLRIDTRIPEIQKYAQSANTIPSSHSRVEVSLSQSHAGASLNSKNVIATLLMAFASTVAYSPLLPGVRSTLGSYSLLTKKTGIASKCLLEKSRFGSCATARMLMDGQLASRELSRRNLLRGAFLLAGVHCSGTTSLCAQAYTVEKAKPSYKAIYAEAQPGEGPLRILEIGSGLQCASVFQGRFRAGSDLVALDLQKPDEKTLRDARTFAAEHGFRFRFEQGDATNLSRFKDGSFDAVVCSLFLCQDFNPEVVVSEIRRVLKPGGRFGFVEHVEDIDQVIIDKVFGESSVIRFQRYPQLTNLVGGIVMKT